MEVTDAVAAQDEKRHILVVGAGIIGLTTAIRLREAGHEVLVIAEETPSTIFSRDSSVLKSAPPGTYTSSGSGGLWMPFMLDGDNVMSWSTIAFETFKRQTELGIGVDMLEGFLLRANSTPTELPWYADMTNMKVMTHDADRRIPVEYQSALKFTTPIVQMEVYMLHLENTAVSLGIQLELTASHTPDGESTMWKSSQVADFALSRFQGIRPVVINCCGLGARFLASDETIPGRGVTVRVKRPADKRYFITEDITDPILSRDGLLAYCIPRGDEYTLGGTNFEGDWSEISKDDEVQALLSRVDCLIPGIATAEQTGTWSGLRPLRADGTARVEIQAEGLGGREGIDVVACYAHGGNGVTVCWGSAEEVVKIVARMSVQ